MMQRALELARQAGRLGEVPVGAIVTRDNKVIAEAHNEVETAGQSTHHAEILAIQRASASTGQKFLTNCTLWVTLEPCPMCASAIANARIGKLVFGASDPKSGGVLFGPQIFDQPTCHHVPEVQSGQGAQESEKLLREFFQNLR